MMKASQAAAVLSGIAVLLLIVLLLPQAGVALPGASTSRAGLLSRAAGNGQPSGLTVTGEGKVSAAPDLTVVTVGVTTRSQSARQATAENSQAMQALIDALKAAGIAERDIQTVEISLHPETDFPEEGRGRPRVTGYVARNLVSAKVREPGRLGSLLDSLSQAGANEILGIGFTIEDPAALKEQARAEAVAAARQRAQELARLAGVSLGPITAISESSFAVPRGGDIGRMAEAAGLAPVQPGELEIQAQVTLTYEIR